MEVRVEPGHDDGSSILQKLARLVERAKREACLREGFAGARWFESAEEIFSDASVVAVAIEGRNHESLAMAHTAIDAGKHLLIPSPHPSPFSAHKGFFGSKPFSRANEYLVSNGKTPIDWA